MDDDAGISDEAVTDDDEAGSTINEAGLTIDDDRAAASSSPRWSRWRNKRDGDRESNGKIEEGLGFLRD